MIYLIAALVGMVSGLTSGLFGVGGGLVMVPAMTLLMGMDIKRAIGTSLVVIIPTAIIGSYKHFTQGNVDWRTAAMLVPTAIVGSYLGAHLTTLVPSGGLKRAFGAFIIVVGLRLVLAK